MNNSNKLFNKNITASSKCHSFFQENTLAHDVNVLYVDSHCQTLESGGLCAEFCGETDFDIGTIQFNCISICTDNILSETFPVKVINEVSFDCSENSELCSIPMHGSPLESACESSTQTLVSFK